MFNIPFTLNEPEVLKNSMVIFFSVFSVASLLLLADRRIILYLSIIFLNYFDYFLLACVEICVIVCRVFCDDVKDCACASNIPHMY